VQKGHREVHSSSLVPQNDPTLLFTNAGMNQFKDVFLGLEKRDYLRATTSQKCVRAGGKHNDLENVGFTNRHHTFFEMLGNFSFGDYFKEKAIPYAWELITSKEWFGIPQEKLYVTVFDGEGGLQRDAEAYDLWVATGVAKDRIYEMGLKDNFWQMGDTGPCGPCSEIHYDMGSAASEQGHTDCAFTCDCGRYVEIWNLVFMQFNRVGGGERFLDENDNTWKYPNYRLDSLPKPSVDTGMGLERVTAVLQGVISNYDTDLFTPLMLRGAELLGCSKDGLSGKLAVSAETLTTLRVAADHSRAVTFLINDGVLPANEGRGYVLRKIMRRAITLWRLQGKRRMVPNTTEPFLYKMVYAVRDLMQDAYPELAESADRISRTVLAEEKHFGNTVAIGLDKLEEALFLAGTKTSPGSPLTLSGKYAFSLYDTYGLPLDFIEDVLRDRGAILDRNGFDQAMEDQKSRSRASWKGAAKQTANPVYQQLPKSVFEGYRQTRSDGCEVLAIIRNGQGVQELKAGEEGEVILDHTPFYAESGGQVGDRGWFYSDDHNTVVAEVKGCYSPIQGVRAHQMVVKSPIRVGDKVDAVVNTDIREATMRNHTATHLLHAGLREVLGKHVKQAGSLVVPDHLRFDFSHFAAVEDEELQDIEDIINKQVLRNTKVEVINDVPIDVAVNEYHAMALFGEKYGDKVRVIKIGDFSTELCGGTHTGATGEIGLIKILKEASVSSGVRRVEAVTGEGSLQHFRQDHEVESFVSSFAHAKTHVSPRETLRILLHIKDEEIKKLTHELDQARMKSASASTANIGEKVKEVKGVKVLAHRVDNLERTQMRTLVDQLRDKIGSGVVVLGSASNGNVALIVGVTKDLTSRVQAGKVVGKVAEKVGGKGGGRPDLAEAGGKDAAALDAALDSSYRVVEGLLA
jgi:alanyl-tRNA synthetase